jgi:hypothetical protein
MGHPPDVRRPARMVVPMSAATTSHPTSTIAAGLHRHARAGHGRGRPNCTAGCGARLRSGGRGGAPPSVRVERLGRDVGLVRPDDRSGLGIGAQLAEERGVAERLEDTPVVEEVREIDLGGGAIRKANLDVETVARGGLNQERAAAHGPMVARLEAVSWHETDRRGPHDAARSGHWSNPQHEPRHRSHETSIPSRNAGVHRFTAFARQASTLPLEVATPEQIGRWIVVIIRWPHFVRWMQAQRNESASPAPDPARGVLEFAVEAETSSAFTKALGEHGLDASWTDDEELWE